MVMGMVYGIVTACCSHINPNNIVLFFSATVLMTIVTIDTGVYKPTDNVWGAHIAFYTGPRLFMNCFRKCKPP